MTRVRLPGSVRNQTTVVAAGVVSVALILAAFGLVGLLRHRLIDAERVAARVRADDVVALARTGTLPNPLSFPGEDSGATQVLDAKGKVIAATENIEDDSPLSTLRPDVGDHESVIMTGLPMEEDDRYLIVATTAVVGGKRVTVQAAASLESADDTLATLTRTLLWGVPALILLVAATTRLLVGLALRPVGAITDEVADLTQADLHRRVPEPGSSDEIARLAITMNEMLARLDGSETHKRRVPTDLEALTRTVVDRRVEPDVTFACTGPAIALVDGAQIDRVLTNLLDNAARHRRSRTDVTVGRGDTTVDITVDDDGPGVPEPERNRVFEPFTRLDAARTADQGTGLGLAIVAEIVGDLGGKVRLVDSPLGGARFVVSLPSAVVGPDAGMA